MSIPLRRTEGDRFAEKDDLTIEELLEAHFRITPGATLNDAAYMHIASRGDETIFGTVGGSDHEWLWGYVLGGELVVQYLVAWIDDCLARSLNDFVLVGFSEWLRQCLPYASTGRINLSPEALKSHFEEIGRAKMRAGSSTVADVARLIPVVGWIVGVLLELFALLAPVAAGWNCPLAPFKRSVADPDCATLRVQGEGEYERILTETLPTLVDRGAPGSLRVFTPTEGVPPQFPLELPPAPEKPFPWGTLLLAGGGAAGIVALIRYLRR